MQEELKESSANEISVQGHLDILALASHYVDSAVSKTCNVGEMMYLMRNLRKSTIKLGKKVVKASQRLEQQAKDMEYSMKSKRRKRIRLNRIKHVSSIRKQVRKNAARGVFKDV